VVGRNAGAYALSAAQIARETDITQQIVFGIAEMVNGFRQVFFSIRPAHSPIAAFLDLGMGVLYFFAGALILTRKKSAAALALCFLAGIILGRVAVVLADLYPTDSVSQLFAIVIETSIACAFFVVVALKWENFV
jgi:hypothetical protein